MSDDDRGQDDDSAEIDSKSKDERVKSFHDLERVISKPLSNSYATSTNDVNEDTNEENEERIVKNWILQKYQYEEILDCDPSPSSSSQEPVVECLNSKFADLSIQRDKLQQDAILAKKAKDNEKHRQITKNLCFVTRELHQISKSSTGFDLTTAERFLADKRSSIGLACQSSIDQSKDKYNENNPQVANKDISNFSDEEDSTVYDVFEQESTPAPMKTRYPKLQLAYTRDQWTGKSPKQFFRDWLSKNAQGTSAKYLQIAGNESYGFRFRCVLVGGKKEYDLKQVEMAENEVAETIKEAEHYVSMKMLYLLLPHLPLHRSLPGPYRNAWLDMVDAEKHKQESTLISTIQAKWVFVNDLAIKRIKAIDEALAAQRVDPMSSIGAEDAPNKSQERNQQHELSCRLTKTMKTSLRNNQQQQYYKKLLKQRQELPVFKEAENILQVIEKHNIVIISGETGSGKSTQIPQFILQNALESGLEQCNVVCTQPRRISATSIASRVSEEIGDGKGRIGKKGSLVGYQIRLESAVCETTRLTFCTTGVLLRKIEQDPLLKTITHLIIDEVHERNIESDFLLLILKKLLDKRTDLRIILMSATANSHLFAEYFKEFNVAPVVTVPGRTFPVEQFFLEDAVQSTGYTIDPHSEFAVDKTSSQVNSAQVSLKAKNGKKRAVHLSWTGDDSYQTVNYEFDEGSSYTRKTKSTLSMMNLEKIDYDLIELLLIKIISDPNSKNGSILIFLPGMHEIRRLYDHLAHLTRTHPLLILPLHSSLDRQEQSKVFEAPPPEFRKIVISTNIAETGVTIPDVVYVIDSCKSKQVLFDDRRHVTRLVESFVSKANCLQRRGRAGRVQAGVCYHLVPHALFKEFPDYERPEITRMPLEELCLKVKSIGVEDRISDFLSETIEKPPDKHVKRSIELLYEIGALDDQENLTLLGSKLTQLPVDVRLGRLLIYGGALQCLDAACIIASMISLNKTPFINSFDKLPSNASRFLTGQSDFLSMLKAYYAWSESSEKKRFCQFNFLSMENLIQIRQNYHIFQDLMKKQSGLYGSSTTDMNRHNHVDGIVLVAIATGLYPNLVHIDRENQSVFRTLNSTEPVVLNASSMLAKQTSWEFAQYFSYYSMSRNSTMAGGKSQLSVWDINRVPLCSFIISTQLVNLQVEHRSSSISIGKSRHMIKCSPRTAVILRTLGKLFQKRLASIIKQKTIDQDDDLEKIFLKLVNSEIL